MTVTVIWVAYRTPVDMLRASVDSVRAAAKKSGDELDLILVDNGGAAHLADAIPGIRVLGEGLNVGFGHAVNEGVRHARGEYVLMMNPDSTAHPDLFQEFARASGSANEGTMFGALLEKDGRPQVHAYNVWWSSLALALRKRAWAEELDTVVRLGSPTAVARLCGAGWFARRDDLAALGPFDDGFFLYGEDVDLSLRAKRAGHSLTLVPRAVILHDAGTSSEGSSALVERARTDAHLRLTAIHRGYVRSLAARLESALITIAGALLTRSTGARRARMARLQELWRWGFKRIAPRFDPSSSA